MMAASLLHSGFNLSELLAGMAEISPQRDRTVTAITLDSRQVVPGSLFLACAGTFKHGLVYLDQAIAKGAVAVAFEPDAEWTADFVGTQAQGAGISLIAIDGLRRQVSRIAGRFYAQPSEGISLIGFTGTNGKTSCSQFLAQALEPDTRCGIIGTIGSGFIGALEQGQHTTPDPIAVQSLLAELRDAGAQVVSMEVSSHALDQARVEDLGFDIAVLTNLSRDHLDYHGSMDAYAEAKKRLFDMPRTGCAVLNMDDAFGRQLVQSLSGKKPIIGYGLSDLFSAGLKQWVSAAQIEADSQGQRIRILSSWGEGELSTALLGRFNVSNLLAVLAVLLQRGLKLDDALSRLSRIQTVAGRMERFGGKAQPLVVVDYAHTPDALEQTLLALRDHTEGRLTCLFGCGGDRDTGKRPEMGRIAELNADKVFVTDDNPRGESSHSIIEDILSGMMNPDKAVVISDRAAAIETAIKQAVANDVVLVAGKGHEDYQQIGDLKIPFSDRSQVERVLAEVKS